MSQTQIIEVAQSSPGMAAQLKAIHDVAYRAEADLLGLSAFPPLERTEQSYRTSRSTFFGCYCEGELVGSIETELIDAQHVLIASLVVLPEFSRQGVATRLVEHVLSEAAGMRVEVCTAAGNGPAVALYQRLGFKQVELWETPDGVPMVRFVRA